MCLCQKRLGYCASPELCFWATSFWLCPQICSQSLCLSCLTFLSSLDDILKLRAAATTATLLMCRTKRKPLSTVGSVILLSFLYAFKMFFLWSCNCLLWARTKWRLNKKDAKLFLYPWTLSKLWLIILFLEIMKLYIECIYMYNTNYKVYLKCLICIFSRMNS